jgi:hypothetical protein
LDGGSDVRAPKRGRDVEQPEQNIAAAGERVHAAEMTGT